MNQRSLHALLKGHCAPLGPLNRRVVNIAARSPGSEGGRPPLGTPFTPSGEGPSFSPEQRRRMRQQAVDQEHREKTQKAPEFDAEEDTSFQGRFVFLKVFAYTSVFAYICFQGNRWMHSKLARR